MAKVLNQTFRVPPQDTETADGQPLSSGMFHDMVRALNNLSYCSPWFGFIGTPAGVTDNPQMGFVYKGSDSSSQVLVGQWPTVLPRDAKYLRWTLDYTYANPDNGLPEPAIYQSTIDAIKLYIAPGPYTGQTISTYAGNPYDVDTGFNESELSTGWGVINYSGGDVMTGDNTLKKRFVPMSDPLVLTPIETWMPFNSPAVPGWIANQAWMILTVVRHTSGADSGQPLTNDTMKVTNFSWWVTYE